MSLPHFAIVRKTDRKYVFVLMLWDSSIWRLTITSQVKISIVDSVDTLMVK